MNMNSDMNSRAPPSIPPPLPESSAAFTFQEIEVSRVCGVLEWILVQRMRSAVLTTEFQLERGARDDGGWRRNQAHLANCPDLTEFLPWTKQGGLVPASAAR